jgi:Na+/melibiose symporter-like transporter
MNLGLLFIALLAVAVYGFLMKKSNPEKFNLRIIIIIMVSLVVLYFVQN